MSGLPPLFLAAISTVGVVIVLAGVVTGVVGVRRLRRAWASRAWPSVKGTLVRSEVVLSEEETERSDDEPRPPSTWKAELHYEFEVGGRRFEGTRYALDVIDTNDRGRAADIVRAFPTGATVDVFYEPANPENCVLRPGISGGSAIFPLVGVAMVGLGLSMLWLAWKVSEHFLNR